MDEKTTIGTSAFASGGIVSLDPLPSDSGSHINGVFFAGIENSGSGIFKPRSGEVPVAHGERAGREVAAYIVDQELGNNNVPETVMKTHPIHGEGSVQQWIPGPTGGRMSLEDRKAIRCELTTLDLVIGNPDRHNDNLLKGGKRQSDCN